MDLPEIGVVDEAGRHAELDSTFVSSDWVPLKTAAGATTCDPERDH